MQEKCYLVYTQSMYYHKVMATSTGEAMKRYENGEEFDGGIIFDNEITDVMEVK